MFSRFITSQNYWTNTSIPYLKIIISIFFHFIHIVDSITIKFTKQKKNLSSYILLTL